MADCASVVDAYTALRDSLSNLAMKSQIAGDRNLLLHRAVVSGNLAEQCDAKFSGRDVHTARMPFPVGGQPAEDLASGLRRAAATILPSCTPTVIAFACTTGAAQLGPARLRDAVRRPNGEIEIVTPFDAAIDALAALGARRVAMVTPYSEASSRQLGDHLSAAGFALTYLGYFDADNARIPDLSPETIIDAARRAAAAGSPDVVFLSCTGMRATPLIESLEGELGLPVLTSLQVMAARIATMAGSALSGPGRLFDSTRAGGHA